jgi:hypothetical protein
MTTRGSPIANTLNTTRDSQVANTESTTEGDIMTINLSSTNGNYTLATKYYMMNRNINKGMYIKAVPLDQNNKKQLVAF